MLKLLGMIMGVITFIAWALNKALGILLAALGDLGKAIASIAQNAYWLFPASAALIVYGGVGGSPQQRMLYAIAAALIVAGVMWWLKI